MAGRGRPRAFDREEALRRAVALFWERGYEGTSVGDLTEAMGVSKPSLYAAFGCKEAIFREAIALYDAVEGEPVQRALNREPTARAAVEAVLRHNARAYADPVKPQGCMIVLSSLIGAAENEGIRRFLADARADGEAALRRRIERGVADGDVPAAADARRIAAYYATVLHGLSVQARDGAATEALDAIVDCAMTSWEPLVGSGARRPSSPRRRAGVDAR
jgi:AcrR family transcriptional regulator